MKDLNFVQKCIDGDKQAWDEFISKYSRLIYNYIYSVLRSKGTDHLSGDMVNDLFQEIILSLVEDNFKKLRSFKSRNGCSFATWLRQIVVNRTIDHIRGRKDHISISDEQALDEEFLSDDSLSVSRGVFDKEKFVLLKDCIARLDTDERFFLEMYINQGLSLDTLKELLQVSRGAIDMRKTRIIDSLRECFKLKGFLV
ncbi:MAG: RNA polymerase sigma factor [Candidatus Omnitrophota bacterium]|jgi:RNA polymerase sigma-70 factor (ECF subfamily)